MFGQWRKTELKLVASLMKTNLLICAALALEFSGVAAPLTESTFTEIIRDVNTLSSARQSVVRKNEKTVFAPTRNVLSAAVSSRATPARCGTRSGDYNRSFNFADDGLPALDRVFTSRMISVNVLSVSGAATPEKSRAPEPRK